MQKTRLVLSTYSKKRQVGSVWYGWPQDSQLSLVNQIQEVETTLASVSFSVQGSIYYKSDLKSKGVIHAPLDSSIVHMDDSLNPETTTSLASIFAIGTSTDPKLWMAERVIMNLSRGPFNEAPSDLSIVFCC